MSDTNLIRRTERKGTAAAAASTVLMEAEIGYVTDEKKLIVGNGDKPGGFVLTPDNVVALWPDESDESAENSLAWWIAHVNGAAAQLRLPAGTYTIAGDLTVPGNITLMLDTGAQFNVASGHTLTLNCGINAWEVVNTGEGTIIDNAHRKLYPNENLIRHNISCWERGRMDVIETITVDGEDVPNPNWGKNYNHPNTDVSAVRYKYRIPVTAGEKYTIKTWGEAGCRLFFYKIAEGENYSEAPHYDHYEDTILSDDECVGTALAGSNRTNVDRLKAGYTFTVPDTADYMRLYAYNLNSAGRVSTASLLNVGDKILFKLEKGTYATAYTPAPADSNIYNEFSTEYIKGEPRMNNPVAARQLVNCMASYAGKGWAYGAPQLTENPANKEWSFEGPAAVDLFLPSAQDSQHVTTKCEKALDCQTPVLLAIAGIPYWQSRYELYYNRWRGVHLFPWGKYPDITRGSALAEWCYRNGWEIKPGINYSKLQAGDIVFWHTNEYKKRYLDFKNGFRRWDHVAMFTGRWVASTDYDEADGRLHPEVIESGGYGATLYTDADGVAKKENVVFRRFLDRISSFDLEHDTSTTSGAGLEAVFFRVPLETPYAEYISAAHHKNTLEGATLTDTDDMIYSASYHPSIYISGNTSQGDLNIDIYGMNAAIWESGGINSHGENLNDDSRIRTGYMPATWMIQNKISNTDYDDWLNVTSGMSQFTLLRRAFYDGNFEFISELSSSRSGTIPSTAKYVRYCFFKSNDDDLTEHEITGFRQFTAVQPNVHKTVASVADGVISVSAATKPRLAYEAKKTYYDGVNTSESTYRAYKQGYHSYVHIAAEDLGLPANTSYTISSLNGEYNISTDGIVWEPLSAAIQTKLKALRIGDGENYIYVPNGQSIYLSNAED